MWLYPLPGLVSILGWLYILGTSAGKAIIFAVAVFVAGSATFFIRARRRSEWPFQG
jgi:hypothetical protein